MEFWLSATRNSCLVVIGVAFLSCLIAIPSAWLVERSDIPGAKWLRALLTFPYIVPSYLLAVAWIILANPDVGWINQWARSLLGIPRLMNIYSLGGIIFIESTALFPILFIAFRTSLRSMDPSLEEAARLSGASPVRVFRSITLPLLRDGLLLALVAVGLASLASFGVPAMIGGPARVFVLTTGIYDLLKQGTLEGFHGALIVALRMAIAALVIVVGSKFFLGKKMSLVGGKSSRPSLVELGAWRKVASGALWTLWLLIVAFPLSVLVFSSFQSDPNRFALSSLSLRAWKYVVLSLPEFREAIVNSFGASILTAVLVLLVAIAVALLKWSGQTFKRRSRRAFSRIIEESSFLLYSIPGTVLALLLLLFSARMGALGLFRISDTLFILVLAYALKYSSLGLNTLIPTTMLIHPSLIESAQLSGASFVQRLGRVWIPLMRPGLIAAGLLVFMPCLSELTMSVLLYGPSTHTLGVVLFQLQEYADRPSAAVVGTLLLVTVIAIQGVLGLLSRREERLRAAQGS
jgi:iron(III) transport system permease protein